MPTATAERMNFSIGQARHIVRDLFTPNPWIYWADFFSSLIGGAVCFALVRRWAQPFTVEQIVLFVLSGVLYYRAALFIHELIHLRDNSFRAFRVAWNLFCGIPFLMPSFMYYTHIDHHMRKHFGTHEDGEYLALATMHPRQILLYFLQPFAIPLLALLRFLVLAPLSWVVPSLRDFVHRRASAMVIDPSYIRPLPTRKTLRIFHLQEALCFFLIVGFAIGALYLRGPRHLAGFVLQAYCTSVLVLTMNHVRTLGAHRYTNAGGEMTFVQQLLDSVNYPRHPLTSALWAPVGLRFHALHHLFPSLPYHNLGKAHKRLMAELPADSPYRLTESPSLWAAIQTLWANSRASAQRDAAPQPGRAAAPAQRFETREASGV